MPHHPHRRRRLALASAAALSTLITAPTAGAVPFGPDLSAVTPTSLPTFTCNAKAPWAIFEPSGAPSCMYSALDFAGPSLRSPISGTVTAVSVKVGAVTGPMRVNVIRSLYQNKIYVGHPQVSGPFLQAYGPTFTPAANSTTTIPVALPMQQDPTPSQYDLETIAVSDALALEVLAPNVPVPLFPAAATTVTYGVYPGPTQLGLTAPNLNPLPSYGTTGIGVALSADITAGSTPIVVPGSTSPGSAPAGAATPVTLGRTTVPVRSNAARVPLICQVADCAGVVTLLRSLPAGAQRSKASGAAARSTKKTTRKKAKKPAKLGSAKFTTTQGKTKTVKVKLNSTGRRLSRQKKRFTAYARVTYKSGAPTTYFKVRLKR